MVPANGLVSVLTTEPCIGAGSGMCWERVVWDGLDIERAVGRRGTRRASWQCNVLRLCRLLGITREDV